MRHFPKIVRKPTIFAVPIRGYEIDSKLKQEYILNAFGRALKSYYGDAVANASSGAILHAMCSKLDMIHESSGTETGCAQEG